MKTFFMLILLFVLMQVDTCLTMCIAQTMAPHEIAFEHLNKKQGLSDGTVLTITQDKRGFIWFGTEDGLNRWDGYGMKVFRQNPRDTSSLAKSYVNALYEDKEGTLWVGTKGGLSRFNRAMETFTTYRADGKAQSLSNAYVTSLVEDARSGYLWVGTYGGGLCRMNKKTGEFKHYRKKPNDAGALQDDIIRCLATDKVGALWIGTSEGFYRYMTESDSFLRFSPPGDSRALEQKEYESVECLTTDSQGRIWVGLSRFGMFCAEYNPSTRSATFTAVSGSDPASDKASRVQSVQSARVSAIMQTRSGALWAATDDGLASIDPITKRIQKTFRRQRGEQNSLGDNTLYSLYEDRTGTIWIGTVNGVSFFNPKTQRFVTYHSAPYQVSDQKMIQTEVRAFAEDKNGKIWIADNNGIRRMENHPLSGGMGIFKAVPTTPQDISALHISRQGTLWIGTESNGLYALRQAADVKNKPNFEHFVSAEDDEFSLSGNSVLNIIEDNGGKIWVATHEGISRLDSVTPAGKARFTSFLQGSADGSSFENILVSAVCKDRQGQIWMGVTENRNKPLEYKPLGGRTRLARLDPSSGNIIYYNMPEGNASRDLIVVLCESKTGDILIASEDGLYSYNPTTEKITSVELNQRNFDEDIQRAIRGDGIYSMKEDEAGTLWIGTGKGVIRYIPKTAKVRLYDERDGLVAGDLSLAFRTHTGIMLFGGTNGFTAFQPDSLTEDTNTSKTIFTLFTKFGQPIPLDTAIAEKQHIMLKYDNNNFELGFAAMSFSHVERIRYRYRLEGFDSDWNYTGDEQHDARYTNLIPMVYTFQVQASHSDGGWSEISALTIEIVPPFWLMWWFRLLLITVAGAVSIVILLRRKGNNASAITSAATFIVLLVSETIEIFAIQPIIENILTNNQSIQVNGTEKIIALVLKIITFYFLLVPLERILENAFRARQQAIDLTNEEQKTDT